MASFSFHPCFCLIISDKNAIVLDVVAVSGNNVKVRNINGLTWNKKTYEVKFCTPQGHTPGSLRGLGSNRYELSSLGHTTGPICGYNARPARFAAAPEVFWPKSAQGIAAYLAGALSVYK